MTLEVKFIPKDGAKEAHKGYRCVPHEIVFVKGDDPIPIWKDGCSQVIFDVKTELTFLFVKKYYIRIIFSENCHFFMDSFSYLKVLHIYSWYNLESFEVMKHMCSTISWSWMIWIDYQQLMNIINYCDYIDVISKSSATTCCFFYFLFQYNKKLALESLLLDNLEKPQYAPRS